MGGVCGPFGRLLGVAYFFFFAVTESSRSAADIRLPGFLSCRNFAFLSRESRHPASLRAACSGPRHPRVLEVVGNPSQG